MTENKTITVVGCQMLQNLGDREANIRTAVEMIRATPGYDIYVLPELSRNMSISRSGKRNLAATSSGRMASR